MTVSTIGPRGPGTIPEWDMQDRLNKALRSAGISVSEAADYFDVVTHTDTYGHIATHNDRYPIHIPRVAV